METDDNPLVWLNSLKTTNWRLISLKIKLDKFDYTISYKKGKDNVVADALSRVEINIHSSNDDSDTVITD